MPDEEDLARHRREAALLDAKRDAASLAGLVALGSGILTVVNATEATQAVLVIATLLLWATATLRHIDRAPAAAGDHRLRAGGKSGP